MATSGSSNFSNTAVEIITDALYKLVVLDATQSLPDDDLQLGLRTLNRMLKTWAADGVHLWLDAEGTLNLTADDSTYTMGTGGDFSTARPLEIYTARFVQSSDVEIPMKQIAHKDYYNLPNKAASGTPTLFYYNPRGGANSTGQFITWPVVSEASKTIKFTYRRPIEDFDASADDPDLPQEWLEAMIYNLALRLAPDYGAPITQEIAAVATETYSLLRGWDRETPSLCFGPSEEGW